MGEVYKALDTRLERTVAVKVLPPELLSSNPELKTRFEREAKAISALQHPYICTLFDVGSQDGVDYLVMEYLEGETLAARIEKGAMPIEQVLKTGIEIADALDKAHRQGILHRDLKPGNVMLTKAGAKLMDFGLAKPALAVATSSGMSLTAAVTRTSPASPITQAGTIVGTFQYMAPEQLEGREADARSDIFALGTVLYEMATGKRPFEGKSQISVMSAILEKEPEPISAVKPATPPAFEHLVARALAKDPDERWQTAADVKSELKWISQTSSTTRAAGPGIKRKRYQKWMVTAAVALAAVVVTAATMWMLGAGKSPDVVQAFILPPEGGQFIFTGQGAGPPAISPDGTKIVFEASAPEGKRLLWVRTIRSLTPLPIAGTEGAVYPFWSPDSQQIGFFQDGKMKRVDVAGGPVTTIADAAAGRGGSWAGDGTIIFSPSTNDAIHRVSSAGGRPEPVTKIQPNESSNRWPWFLPGGKHFVFLAWNQGASGTEGEGYTIYAASVEGGERKLVVTGATNPSYANGYLFYVRAGNLLAQRFNLKALKVEGDPVPMFERVQSDPQFGRANYSVSQTGGLVFVNGPSAAEARVNWVSPDGRELGPVGGAGNWSSVRISPDGKWLAATLDPGNADIWLLSLTREMRSRLTFDASPDTGPVWSPDSKRIAFTRMKAGKYNLMVRNADGSGSEETWLESAEPIQVSDWSRDGRYISYIVTVAGQATNLWVLPTAGERKPIQYQATPFSEADAMFSPDGRWLIYDSNSSGSTEIYAAPFPGPGGRFQVSSGGGDWPRWTRDGKHVLYSNGDDYYIADVTYDAVTFQVTQTRKLFTMASVGSGSSYSYDVAPDGRIIMVSSQMKASANRLAWISDWRKQLGK